MTGRTQLIAPDESLAESYRGYVQELRDRAERPVPFVLAYEYQDFADLILRLRNDSLGVNLQDWQVPCSTFWLVDENRRLVGVSNLRHRLTEKLRVLGGHIGFGVRPTARRRGFGTILLRETLKEAHEMGIAQALLTCNKSNIGSALVIKNNGGILRDEEYIESEKDIVQRYWIET